MSDITQAEIDAARKRLEELWQDQGMCRSCGWHGGLYQYDVDDEDIEEALREEGGKLHLPCVNKDYDCGGRGVFVYLAPETQKGPPA